MFRASKVFLRTSEEMFEGSEEMFEGSEEMLIASEETFEASEVMFEGSEETFGASEELFAASKEMFKAFEELFSTCEAMFRGSGATLQRQAAKPPEDYKARPIEPQRRGGREGMLIRSTPRHLIPKPQDPFSHGWIRVGWADQSFGTSGQSS